MTIDKTSHPHYQYSQRFLTAYAEIEEYLRNLINLNKGSSFPYVLSQASHKEPVLKNFRDDLLQYGELRNALVHERHNGEPIAEPHPDVVDSIERIRQILLSPPQLLPDFASRVEISPVNEPISSSLNKMLTGHYAKLPVYEGKQFIGLLTPRVITLWLANCFKDQSQANPQTAVSEVLAYTQYRDNCVFLSHKDTVSSAINIFNTYSRRGQKLDAILITETGSLNQRPLGILTSSMLPKLYALISSKKPA
jgi:hypothetical protein